MEKTNFASLNDLIKKSQKTNALIHGAGVKTEQTKIKPIVKKFKKWHNKELVREKNKGGFFVIQRQDLKKTLDKSPFIMSLYVFLISEANYKKDTKNPYFGVDELQPGDYITTIRNLQKQFKASNLKIKNGLKILKKINLVDFEIKKRFIKIKLIDYKNKNLMNKSQ